MVRIGFCALVFLVFVVLVGLAVSCGASSEGASEEPREAVETPTTTPEQTEETTGAEEATTEQVEAEEPTAEQPKAEEDEQAAEAARAEEAAAEQAAAEKAAAEQAAAEKAAAEQAAAEEAAAEQAAAEKAAAEQAAAKEAALRPQLSSPASLSQQQIASPAQPPQPQAPPSSSLLYLSLPKLGIYNALVEDSEAGLELGAMHQPGTGYPWLAGSNTYIAGHRIGFPGTGSDHIFYNLPSMAPGDAVILRDSNGRAYTYSVSEILQVPATNLGVTNPVVGRDMVSLQTCIENFGDFTTLGPNWNVRLIVRADRVA